MSQIKRQDYSTFYNFMVYAFALILFLEWIYPVKDVADVLNLNVFIIYAVFCFGISWLRLHWALSFGLKLAGLGLIVDWLFVDAPLLTKAWVSELGDVLAYNINKMEAAQWLDLTATFRTLLFLLLIWLMSYLLYYWFVTAKRMLLFVILTFIYIGVLDTFTVYDGSNAIIRTFIAAFLALGLSNFIKEMNQEALSSAKKWAAWAAPVVLIVLVTSTIGYAAPKFAPQWPDPVPFIESYAEDAGIGTSGNTVQKIGYGENDERLGGSFVQDDTPVFRGAAPDKGYWRVESKAVYTGKGWKRKEEQQFEEVHGGDVNLNTASPDVKTNTSSIKVDFFDGQDIDKLPYQYSAKHFETKDKVNYAVDRLSGAVRMKGESEKIKDPTYQAIIDQPVFNIDDLKTPVPSKFAELKPYTQLPSSLPDRVGELAEELTKGLDNRYDKAKAIEQYFNDSGFKYQIEDVPVPDEDQDYVDQFLFESKEGYCDNYSTTMAVMLRTLDIPTRWVKGFSPGEKVDEIKTDEGNEQTNLNVYEVKSSNAHSWVEVLFPRYGWVPFEPTQGFDNPTDFTTDEELNRMEGSETEVPNDQDEENETESDDQTQQQQEPEQIEQDESDGNTAAKAEDSQSGWLLPVASVLAAVAIAGLIIFFTRWRWKTAYLNHKIRRHPTDQTFQKAYHYMLKVLNHKGLPRQPDQTLRSYARKIDQRFETDLMGTLTTHYEQMLYSRYPSGNHDRLTKSWRLLMKRILS